MTPRELENTLAQHLGQYRKTSGDNRAFKCPFSKCSSHNTDKHKLEVNVLSGSWHCWVCDSKGQTINSLLSAIGVKQFITTRIINNDLQHVVDSLTSKQYKNTAVKLPEEAIPVYNGPNNFYNKSALNYVRSRGLSLDDIIMFDVHYCERGQYSGYIIVPSYGLNGRVNYFATRAYLPKQRKTINPQISRDDVIGFEMFINWKLPIVFVEGVFDAMTVRYNASPLFGKTITKSTLQTLSRNKVKQVVLMLDQDAQAQAWNNAKILTSMGIECKVVTLPFNEDPNSLGRAKCWELINESQFLTYDEIIFKLKLQL